MTKLLAPLRLPRKLEVRTAECGDTSMPYQPGGTVTVCYEYIAMIERAAPEEAAATRTLPEREEGYPDESFFTRSDAKKLRRRDFADMNQRHRS